MIEAKIKFIDVLKCGFYSRNTASPLFGSLCDSFDDLISWASSKKKIINTQTFTGTNIGNIKNVYYLDSSKDSSNDDFVIVLWNETLHSDGTTLGINPNSAIGKTSILSTSFSDPDAIPGVPSYFWVVPKKKVCATIKFGHSETGKGAFDEYVNGFLSTYSKYRVINQSNNIVGYSGSGTSSDLKDPSPLPNFVTKYSHSNAVLTEVLGNANNITQILKVRNIESSTAVSSNKVVDFLSDLLRVTPNISSKKTYKVWEKITYKPTVDEIKEIFENYHQNTLPSPVDQVGFVYNNGGKTMLDRKFISEKIDLDLNYKRGTTISANDLLIALRPIRQSLLSALD